MDFQKSSSLRLLPVGLLALSISLPVAWIGLSKLILLISAILLIFNLNINKLNKIQPIHYLITASFVLPIISSLWTSAPDQALFKSILQHGNLLIIPLMALHIKTKQEAITIFKIYTVGQFFIVLSTWLIFLGYRPIWAFDISTGNGVFTTYLDQSIMNAIFVATLWHLKNKLLTRYTYLTLIPILLSITAVLYILQGRSGYIVMFALLCMSIWWMTPVRYKIFGLITSILLLVTINTTSDVLNQRFKAVADELQNYSEQENVTTSTGIRLDFWITSIEMIKQNPVLGSGAGSWSNEFRSIKQQTEQQHSSGNPHQEYLLWGVEFGAVGIILLLAIFALMFYDSTKMQQPEQRATLSVLVGVMVACLFNCSLHDALIGDHLSFLMGLCLAFNTREKV